MTSIAKQNIEEFVFDVALPEMFKRVGCDPANIPSQVRVPRWFTTNVWSVEDEQAFKEWLVPQLIEHFDMAKKLAEKEADAFLFNFGWSTGKEKQGELPL